MTNQIGVSVCIFTYNYEKYLAQAIESVLSQETRFPVEIVIGDDCSTDNTRLIAKNYYDKFPDRIVLSFNENNIGGTKNWINTINQCKGKYIALLDGDDYFTDVLKLQKQYDVLESNPEYVLSFHSVEEKYENVTGNDKVVVYEKEEYLLEDFLRNGWFIRTAATFFKNGIIPQEPPAWVYDFPYRYDTILHVFLCKHGKAIALKDVMSVWRKHVKGMSYVLMENSIKNAQQEIKLGQQLDLYTGKQYTSVVKDFVAESYSNIFKLVLKSKKPFRHINLLLRCITCMDYKYLTRDIFTRLKWK
jgi:glycosyltransferase involved in cell wall biosynthesis